MHMSTAVPAGIRRNIRYRLERAGEVASSLAQIAQAAQDEFAKLGEAAQQATGGLGAVGSAIDGINKKAGDVLARAPALARARLRGAAQRHLDVQPR